jgi:hypothetical protein
MLLSPNVELTGAARLYRAASSDRRERGRAQGYTPDIKQAGAYTAEEAAKHEDAQTVAVPVEWLHQNARIRMTVDAGDSHAVEQAFWSPSKLREALAPNVELRGAEPASSAERPSQAPGSASGGK